MENGRRYCGDYYLPCDEDEQTREWLIHSVYRDLFHSELTTVPLEDPKYVLDIGTGIGEWATDFAEKHPDCQVFGTDIAPLQPTGQVPVNVEWNLEDAEVDWARPPDMFDLVHLRNMAGAFADWPFIYEQAYHCIRPGGWIEVLDFDDHKAFKNFVSFFPAGSPAHILTNSLQRAHVISGRPKDVSHMDEKCLVDAGFVDIQTSTYDLPIGHRENPVFGNKWLLALCMGIEGIFLRSLTTHLGMEVEYVRQLCQALTNETRRLAEDPVRAKGFVVKLRVIVGKKPSVPGQWTARALAENGEISDYSGDESTIGSRSVLTIRSEETI
jgi:SAM-dependent methyltransferase